MAIRVPISTSHWCMMMTVFGLVLFVATTIITTTIEVSIKPLDPKFSNRKVVLSVTREEVDIPRILRENEETIVKTESRNIILHTKNTTGMTLDKHGTHQVDTDFPLVYEEPVVDKSFSDADIDVVQNEVLVNVVNDDAEIEDDNHDIVNENSHLNLDIELEDDPLLQDQFVSTELPTNSFYYSKDPIILNDWKKIAKCKTTTYGSKFSFSYWIKKFATKRVLQDDVLRAASTTRLRRLKKALETADWEIRDWKHVPIAANAAGYAVCRIEGLSQGHSTVLAWIPKYKGDMMLFTRHKTDVADKYEPTPLVLEVPHALFGRILTQTLHIFQETDAKALLLSTSHRCAKANLSGCTGNFDEPIRTKCPKRTKYANGDTAHATQTSFHTAHLHLSTKLGIKPTLRNQLVASMHLTSSYNFVISDGTSIVAPPTSAVHVFSEQMGEQLPERNVLVCNVPRGKNYTHPQFPNVKEIRFDHTHICGASNVQARHMNGSPDECHQNITREGLSIEPTDVQLHPSGNFVRVQQPVEYVKPSMTKGAKPLAYEVSTALSIAAIKVFGDSESMYHMSKEVEKRVFTDNQ